MQFLYDFRKISLVKSSQMLQNENKTSGTVRLLQNFRMTPIENEDSK